MFAFASILGHVGQSRSQKAVREVPDSKVCHPLGCCSEIAREACASTKTSHCNTTSGCSSLRSSPWNGLCISTNTDFEIPAHHRSCWWFGTTSASRNTCAMSQRHRSPRCFDTSVQCIATRNIYRQPFSHACAHAIDWNSTTRKLCWSFKSKRKTNVQVRAGPEPKHSCAIVATCSWLNTWRSRGIEAAIWTTELWRAFVARRAGQGDRSRFRRLRAHKLLIQFSPLFSHPII